MQLRSVYRLDGNARARSWNDARRLENSRRFLFEAVSLTWYGPLLRELQQLDCFKMTPYDKARENLPYWSQWSQNRSNLALSHCAHICAPPVHLRDFQFCLDCHGRMKERAAFIFVCESCRVIHGISGGNSSPYARFHRCGQLKFTRANIEHDFSELAVLSKYPPFVKWLARRDGGA